MSEIAKVEQHEITTKSQPITGQVIQYDHMIVSAIQNNVSPEALAQLLAVKEKWEAGEARKAFVTAMAKFKANPPKITKNKHVKYQSKNGLVDYWHASLDHITDIIGAALAQVGISYRWETAQENGAIIVTCYLTHEDGHTEKSVLSAAADQSGGKNSIQAVGSTVTYLQRYTLLSATGMATEDQDDDGRGSEPPPAANQKPAEMPLNDVQLKKLRDAMKMADVNDAAMCKRASVERVEDITQGRLAGAMNWLKSKSQGGAK